ncbi:MAG: class I SAM-dependent methyltransferase [Firmicutes bacterium]|nr:class I SAM-dependent methyltransferase [Bacillota bacterium]
MEQFFGFAKELLDKGIATVEEIYGENNLYDFSIQFTDDLDFYLELASTIPGKILDIGCGTGRLLIPLLEQGREVVGLDYSADMLKIARDKCEAYGYSPALIQGDMREFSLNEQFNLIMIPYHSLIYMTTEQDRLAVFQRVYEHLQPGGIFAFDFDTRVVKIGVSFPWIGFQGIHPFTNEVILQVVQEKGLTTNLRLLNQVNYRFGKDPKVTVESSLEATISAEHVQSLLEQVGFQVEAMYGNYQKEAYQNHSECIVVARK